MVAAFSQAFEMEVDSLADQLFGFVQSFRRTPRTWKIRSVGAHPLTDFSLTTGSFKPSLLKDIVQLFREAWYAPAASRLFQLLDGIVDLHSSAADILVPLQQCHP